MVAMYGSNGSDKGDIRRLTTAGKPENSVSLHETHACIRSRIYVAGSGGGLLLHVLFPFWFVIGLSSTALGIGVSIEAVIFCLLFGYQGNY